MLCCPKKAIDSQECLLTVFVTEAGPCLQFAATIDVPGDQVVADVYLASLSGSVTELSLRSSGRPPRPWPAPSDAEIPAAINRQVCKAWRCG